MKLHSLLLPLVAVAALAAQGEAQVVELGFRKHFKHGSISIALSNAERSECRPVYRVWVPGHYEMREERVWVPGACRRVWVEPVYSWRSDYRGCRRRVLVREGYWESVQEPGHYETRRFRVWVEGCWTSR